MAAGQVRPAGLSHRAGARPGLLPRTRTARPIDIERVPLEEAEGIVCTGLFDDRTETPDDYRATILYGKIKGLKLLCANPDIVVDVGDRRIYCAGAIAAAYTAAGGRSYYFGKPHPPIYALARRTAGASSTGFESPPDEILCIGDGIATDIQGAMGESLDCAVRHRRPRRRGDRDDRRLRARSGSGSPPSLPRRALAPRWRWPTCDDVAQDSCATTNVV